MWKHIADFVREHWVTLVPWAVAAGFVLVLLVDLLT